MTDTYEVVERKNIPSLGAAIAYATKLAYDNQKTVYVRKDSKSGDDRAVARAEWNGTGVTVTSDR